MPQRGDTKLTPAERAEVVRRYEAGETTPELAKTTGMSQSGIVKLLHAEGAKMREVSRLAGPQPTHRSQPRPPKEPKEKQDPAMVNRKHWELPVHEITADRWQEIYWGVGSGYPSMETLANRFGVSRETIRRHLKRHGISVRSVAEQNRIEGKRRAAPKSKPTSITGPTLTATHCAWCGLPFQRRPCDLARKPYPGCTPSHAVKAAQFRRYHPNESRPLIWALLKERLASGPATLERAEEIGAALGATEDEIFDVLLETQQ